MTTTERTRVRRRRHILAAAAVIAASSCAHPTKPPVTAGSLSDRDVVRLRNLDPQPRDVKPKKLVVRPHHPRPARIGTAVHISIPKVWADLVQCEAHGDWRYGAPGHPGDPGYRSYEGGPNFVHSTWLAYGGAKFAAHAFDATPLQQLVIARRVLRSEGVTAWPVCGPKVGLTLSDAA